MDIGSRIKQARLEAGLSQRQLCGDTITRNMLSLIESGKARPGMDTLTFLASRLGRPVGWFLEEAAAPDPVKQARQAWEGEDFSGALELLENCRETSAERYLLEALCRMALAEQAVQQGKKLYARELLEQARAAGEKSSYYTPELEQRRLLIGCAAEPDGAWAEHVACPDRTLKALAAWAFQKGDIGRCAALLDATEQRDEAWHLLRGRCFLEQGDPERAAELLHRAEQTFAAECIPLLEHCYRDMGDFKRAYEYACLQR